LTGSGYPRHFQRPLAAKLCIRPPKVLEAQERARGPLSPCQVWWGSETLSFLFVCLCVRHAFERQSLCAQFREEGVGSTETILIPLDRGRFVVVHPCSTFSTGDTTKCRSKKNGKNWRFSPTGGDRINRSRRNLARKRILWVCCSTPNLALISKRSSVQEPPKRPKLPKIVFFLLRNPTQ